MSVDIGIIGLAKSGRTTIFNALTRGEADTGRYAQEGSAPHIGIAKVPEPRLKVFSTCTETIKEFKKYKYPEKDKHGEFKPGEKAETPEKHHDHCMDDIRYACVQAFGYLSKQLYDIVSIRKG